MKTRLTALAALLFFVPSALLALDGNSMADIIRAQVIIGQVQQALAKMKEVQAVAGTLSGPGEAPPEPTAPPPLANTDKAGKFFLPYDAEGNLTGWAQKALGAQVGAAVGAKVGEKAGTAIASKVPFAGGLLAMGAKKKGKELGAIAALGGAKYIMESSTYSFRQLDDLALYLHLECSGNEDYIKAFAAAMALYPELEQTYEATVKKAYSR